MYTVTAIGHIQRLMGGWVGGGLQPVPSCHALTPLLGVFNLQDIYFSLESGGGGGTDPPPLQDTVYGPAVR